MFTLSAKLSFYIPFATSLKDKRQIRKSLIDKTRHRYNAAIAEIDTMDVMQVLTLGVAVVSGDGNHRQQQLDEIIRFMERHTDADVTSIDYFS